MMKTLYKLFGSFEIIGNPSSLFKELKKGFNDFLVVPFKELKDKRNLKIFGKKIASGTKSFAVSIVSGSVGAIISIAEALTRYLDYFTFDQKFRYHRQKLRDVGINGFVDGAILGARTLKFGRTVSDPAFVNTIVSVYTIPRNIYLEKGFWLMMILAPMKVVLSTVFKPPLGVYDFIFCVVKGLGSTIIPDYSMLRFRKRPPRIFGEDGHIIPYNYDHAVGNDYIRRLEYQVADNEIYKYFESGCFKINGKKADFAVILTDIHLFLVVVHKYTVKMYGRIKLHKLKRIELRRQTDEASIEVHTHVKVLDGRTHFSILKMDWQKAQGVVQNVQSIMQSLHMDIEVNIIDAG